MTKTLKTTATFHAPFPMSGRNETLPEGAFGFENLLPGSASGAGPGAATARVHLQTLASHSGPARKPTLPLGNMDGAFATDKRSGSDLTDRFVNEKLADPMIQLFMAADGVCEAEIRELYLGRRAGPIEEDAPATIAGSIITQGAHAGMSPRSGSPRPGIGE